MMRVAARAGGSFMRPVGSPRWIGVTNVRKTATSPCLAAFSTHNEKKTMRCYRANVLMAVAAMVSLRPLMTMAEGRVQTQDDSDAASHLKYSNGKACPTYGCPLYPVDIVQQPPKDPTHNQRHPSGVLQSLAGIRNSTRQELVSQQSTSDLTTLSSCASYNQATLTMTGFKGGSLDAQINQDRSFVVSPYYIGDTVPRTLLGVMDGHAARGELISEYVVTELPKLLGQRLQEALQPQVGVVDDLVSTTKRVLSQVFIELDQLVPGEPTGGCTASVVLLQGDTIYIANAGDSVSMIGVYQKSTQTTQIVYTSREDKPHLPDERQRVEEAGGYVYVPVRGTSRVVYVNPRTGAQTGLAMSRSIGDWSFGTLGVVPDPIVDAIHIPTLLQNETQKAITAENECWTVDEDGVVVKVAGKDCDDPPPTVKDDFYIFAVSATDGMMDYVAKDGIMNVVAQSLFEPEGTHPATACELLVNAAAQGWDKYRQGRYRDDIAIAMATLREPPVVDAEEKRDESSTSSSQKEEL